MLHTNLLTTFHLKRRFLVCLFLLVFSAVSFAQVELIALGVLGVAGMIAKSNATREMNKTNNYYDLVAKAKEAIAQQDYKLALDHCNKAIRIFPNDYTAYELRGSIFMLSPSLYDQAILDFTRAIELNNQAEDALLNRGVVYYFKGMYPQAIADYDALIYLRPQYFKVYFYRANAKAKAGEDDAAMKDYNYAITNDYAKQAPEIYYYRGSLYAKNLEDDKALADYQQSISLGYRPRKGDFQSYVRSSTTFLKTRVEKEIRAWQEKQEFEKTSEYKQRVNDATRREKIKSVTLFYQGVWQRMISVLFFQNSLDYTIIGKYDADHETFLLEHPFLGLVSVQVPVSDAKEFKEGIHHMVFDSFHIASFKDTALVLRFVINQKYVYDNQAPAAYENTSIAYDFKPIEYETLTLTSPKNHPYIYDIDSVDIAIPTTNHLKEHTYAVIIGNEDYHSFQTGLSTDIDVAYAINDAEIVGRYVQQTLGVPQKQIRVVRNATSGQLKQHISWLKQMAMVEKGEANILFYYSGHGLPDEETKEGYLIPVDINAENVSEGGISLKYIYKQLSEYPIHQGIVVLDACFSGASKSTASLLARKAVRIEPKLDAPSGNLVVFSSSSKEESSGIYEQKKHGFFTYYFLKEIQLSKGVLTLGSFYDSVKQSVLKETSLVSKPQTPSVQISSDIKEDTWREWNWSSF